MDYVEQKIMFKSFDGVEINCKKLIPKVSNKENIPAVLFEPGNRCTPDDYMWLLKPMVESGWLVLAIYQRGYGSGEPDINDRGGPIQQKDLKLALHLLRSEEIVDISRIAMVGHSNGGHMIQRLAAEDEVKCLVPMSQVSDWARFVGGAKDYMPDYYNTVINEFNGSPEENYQVYRERSCIHLADKIKVPVLSVVGEDDTITPVHLTRNMHEAIMANGNVKAELAIIPGVGHFYEVYAFDGYKTEEVANTVVNWLQKTL